MAVLAPLTVLACLTAALATGCSLEVPDLAPEGPAAGRVTRVIDGDTIEVGARGGGTERVRLLGIDTPETRHSGSPVECGGREATDSMVRLVFGSGVDRDGDGLLDAGTGRGRRVRLRTDPSQSERDRYGRLLAYVRIGTGRTLNEEQVRRGWSKTYVFAGEPFGLTARFRASQREAREAGRGAWSHCGGHFHASGGR